MFVHVSGEYPEVDPYRYRNRLLVQNGQGVVTLRCQTNKEPFDLAAVAPDTYDLLPLHVPGHEENTWTYFFQAGAGLFVATLLYFDDNDWGLIMGREDAEMRFQVPAPLRGAWDRYRKTKPIYVSKFAHANKVH